MNTFSKLVKGVIKAIEKKKGTHITVIDLNAKHETAANTFIICEASNPQQSKAIANEIKDKTQEKPHHIEGLTDANWIVVDYWDVVVHIMTPEHRNLYNIEELWMDMPQYSAAAKMNKLVVPSHTI